MSAQPHYSSPYKNNTPSGDVNNNNYHTPTKPSQPFNGTSPQTIYLSPSYSNYSTNPSILVSASPVSNLQPYDLNQQPITLNISYDDDPFNDELPTQYSLSSMVPHNPSLSNRSSTNSNQRSTSRLSTGAQSNSRPQSPPPPSYNEAIGHPTNVSPITSPHSNNTSPPNIDLKSMVELEPKTIQGRKVYSTSWSEPPQHAAGSSPNIMYHDVFVRKLDQDAIQRSTPNLSRQTFDLYNHIVNQKEIPGDASLLRKEKDLLGVNKELEQKSQSKNAIHPVEVQKEDLEKMDNEQTPLERPEEEILYDIYRTKNKLEDLRKELAAKQSRKSKVCWNMSFLGLDVLEILVTILLINFCVASFWRGTWVLIESYVVFGGTSPERAAQINLIYLGIGIASVGFFQLLSVVVSNHDVHTILHKYWKSVRESFRDSDRPYHKMRPKIFGFCILSFLWIVEKVHVYIVAVGCVFCWRGVFGIWDSYIAPYMDKENQIISGWLSHGLGLVFVLIFGCMNSLTVAPARTTNDRMMSFSGFVGSKWNFITNFIKEHKKTNQERKILKECARRDSVTSN
ncbi:hypothetical protein NAEGRDRAFT_59227 [Naegleria gruberi]|uniref:Uncharacterized protein n=1 Tax=Naegleria gruberi TaxID=5762 RepID=D2VU54_NAEGR|nr:uncharacterized protein NAEGRDRAFT_59227 [Naegleria gruberi]EFC39571.1 hypothetical protein NAEGRDRAFT_59227 [Naegleria gruberi]|eukprot:XP_002672315.1 hypothetical protein NAEGRDRAFT_59227 [Naegleria gruberi strain NEG-M]